MTLCCYMAHPRNKQRGQYQPDCLLGGLNEPEAMSERTRSRFAATPFPDPIGTQGPSQLGTVPAVSMIA
jgi:hypothetical protein